MIHPIHLLTLLVVATATPVALAEFTITGDAVPEMKPFDEMMTRFIADHGVPGASVAIARHGKLIYARGFGQSDREKNEPVTPESRFRIASISKPITAVAIMQLVERGKLKLDDKAFAVLRTFPKLEGDRKPDPRLQEITVAQLLHHTAGFDREKSFDPMFRSRAIAALFEREPPADKPHIMRYMAGRPLDFDPGSRYAYSNFGYCVLGRLIEKTGGKLYAAYVKQEVLDPVGATSMRIGRTLLSDRSEKEVRYYERNPGISESVFMRRGPGGVPLEPQQPPERLPNPYGAWYLEAMDSHGGWLATASDLVRFASSLDDPDKCPILKRESIAAMWERPQLPDQASTAKEKTTDGKPAVYYARGWNVRVVGDAKDGKINTWHLGGLAGTSTLLVRRHDGLTWAVLFNSDFAADKQWLASKVDPLMHQAAAQVTRWP